MVSNRTGIKKGSKVKVDPVRKLKDIKAISKLLQGKPRDLLLWTLGINNGLRASDLVGITVDQVADHDLSVGKGRPHLQLEGRIHLRSACCDD